MFEKLNVFGDLIQQIIYFIFGQIYAGLHFLLSLLISIIIAIISFVFIEKLFIDLGIKIYKICTHKSEFFLAI